METRVFCVELKMGPSGHMDSTGIFPDSNTREFGPRRTTQRQPPRPTHKCNAPRLPFHVHLTHDLTRAASALPLHTAALAFVSFGIVLVQVQVQVRPCVVEHSPVCGCAFAVVHIRPMWLHSPCGCARVCVWLVIRLCVVVAFARVWLSIRPCVVDHSPVCGSSKTNPTSRICNIVEG
jgi:hypothetical protein